MKKTLSILLLLIPALAAMAGDPDYNVATIPATLKSSADAVKRMERYSVRMEGLKDVVVVHTFAITVMNESGSDYADVQEDYGPLRDVKSIKGTLFDAAGKQVRKLKSSEIKDVSGVDNAALMEDTRYKLHSFYHRSYPYTVEYEIVTKNRQSFALPLWIPQEGPSYAVQQSLFEVTVPENYPLRWRTFGYHGEPKTQVVKGQKTFTWEATTLPAIKSEPFSRDWHNRATSVFLGPAEFEMGAYKGQMNSWQDLGTFVFALNKGRDVLPDPVKKTVHQLTDHLTDPKEKIAALYTYLQQNTRYILVMFGIGGFQTYDATYVATRGYGDCKALSNYMCALLKEAGIRANYTLVRAGQGDTEMMEDFPVSRFNHVIVNVPLEKDTVWLECTSQTLPAGYLSGFTADRPVLTVDENGGKLVRTPKYGMAQNQATSIVNAVIAENGDAVIKVLNHTTGQLQDEQHSIIHSLSREKQLEQLRDNISLASYDIVDFGYKEYPGRLPALDEQLHIKAAAYASVTGKRMFIVPNILSRSSTRLSEDSARLSEIFLPYASRSVDTVMITIPAGYKLESGFQPVDIANKFGKYAASAKLEGDRIVYVRSREIYDGMFPPSDVNELKAFYDQVFKSDRSRMVLVKE